MIIVFVFPGNKGKQGVKNGDQRYKYANQGKQGEFVLQPFVKPVSTQRQQHEYGYKLERKCAEFGIFAKGGALVWLAGQKMEVALQWVMYWMQQARQEHYSQP